jgi:glycosyltransferase involved in cell wall biosynthesis
MAHKELRSRFHPAQEPSKAIVPVQSPLMVISFIVKAHLADDDLPLIGGASKNPYRLIKYISRHLPVRRVIYFDGSHSGTEVYSAHAIHVRGLKLYAKTLVQNILAFPAVVKAFRESNIVQCHHPHYGLGASLLRRARFSNAKLVVKAHGTAIPELKANRYRGLKQAILSVNARIHLWHDRIVLGGADIVLCSSEFQKREMIDLYGLKERKLLCIYNGYDQDYSVINLESPAQSSGKRFVFCGRVVPKKGISYAIALFRQVAGPHDTLKLILGKENEIEDRASYATTLREVAEDERISISHDLSEAELYNAFSAADIGLIPSREYESIPTVLIEMLSAGLVVFASYKWGIPEIIPPEFGLSGSIEEDVTKIRDVLRQGAPKSHTELVRHVRHDFNYPALVDEYIALYERLDGKLLSPRDGDEERPSA